jgi:3-methyl-2-oxobutanoate hydroxymethyltransferase
MSGNFPPGRFLPKFVKQYADVWGEALKGIKEYKKEVKSKVYPSQEYTYPMSTEDVAEFKRIIDADH